MGDFKLNNIDTFTRDVENLYVIYTLAMEACNVWLLWYHAWRDVWLQRNKNQILKCLVVIGHGLFKTEFCLYFDSRRTK